MNNSHEQSHEELIKILIPRLDDYMKNEVSYKFGVIEFFINQPEIKNLLVKSVRYDNLKDRYHNQNQKHFDELCGEYFEEIVYG